MRVSLGIIIVVELWYWMRIVVFVTDGGGAGGAAAADGMAPGGSNFKLSGYWHGLCVVFSIVVLYSVTVFTLFV